MKHIKPIYSANKLYSKSGAVSIESQMGEEMHNFPIIWDESAKEANNGYFKVFSTHNDMCSYISSIPQPKRNFHEVIFGKGPQRLRFDIDAKNEMKEMIDGYDLDSLPKGYNTGLSHDMIIQYMRDVIFDLFIEFYRSDIHEHYPGYKVDKDRVMMVTESHSTEKYSFHIIITKFMVKDNSEAAWFMKRVIGYLKQNQPRLVNLIDQQIYTSTQFFRILGCCKYSDPDRPKIISKINMNMKKNIDKGFIQQNNNGDDLLIDVYHNTESMPSWQIVKTGEDGYVITKETEQTCKQIIQEIFKDDYIFKHTKGNLMEYHRRFPSHCKICERRHDQENAYAYISGGVLHWNCRRNTNKEKIMALQEVEETTFDRVKQLMEIKKDIERVVDEDMDVLRTYKENTKYTFDEYSRKEIKDFPKDYDTLFVKAPMKMGKSKQLIKHLKSIKDDVKSILIVSFRRAFTEEFLFKFNDEKRGLVKVFNRELEDYKKIKGRERRISADAHPFVVVQVESLHRVVSKYDTVILDESESIYEQFASTNVKHLSHIIYNFRNVIAMAKRVICMDAYMGERTIELTNELRGINKRNVKFVNNKFKNQGPNSEDGEYTYNIGYCKNEFYNKIKESLANGERIVIMSNTRDKLNAYEKMVQQDFPELNIQSYTSLSKSEERGELKDVNRSWLQYNVVMYSPTITAGISFEEKHFNKVFCLFSNMSCNVLSCMQMIGRIRDVGDRNITICLETHYSRCSVTKEGVEEDLLEHRNELLSIPFNGKSEYSDIDSQDDYFNYKPHKDEYYKMWLHNQLSNNISKKFFARYLIYCIHVTGAKINVYGTTDGEGNKRLMEAQEEVLNSKYGEIASASLIDKREMCILYEKSEKESLTRDEEYVLQKMKLKHTYSVYNDEVLNDREYIKVYYPSKTRYIYYNLTEILSFEKMEDAIQDAAAYECNQIKRFNTEQDSKSDLNYPVKAILHHSCFVVLSGCGFSHILSKEVISYRVLLKNFIETLPLLQRALKVHNLKAARLGGDKATKKLERDEQYFKMCMNATNILLKKFYGVGITKTANDDTEQTFHLRHYHNFLVVDDAHSVEGINDYQPTIVYKRL